MSTFHSRLGINDIIYSVNFQGYKCPYIVREVLFSNKDISYRTQNGIHICYEYELDNINNHLNFYFTSKQKRDNFIKSNNL